MEIYETGNKKPLKPNNIIHIEIHSPWVSTSYRTPSIAACVDTIERKQIFVRLPVRRFSGGESVVVGIKTAGSSRASIIYEELAVAPICLLTGE